MAAFLNKSKSRVLRCYIWARKLWESLDRLSKIGWGITIPWVAVVVTLVFCGDFKLSKLNEFGDFVAGATAPLAFLWLVLGYKQQGKELRDQRVEFSRSVKVMKRQVRIAKDQFKAELIRASNENMARFCFDDFSYVASAVGGGSQLVSEVKNIGASASEISLDLTRGDRVIAITKISYLERGQGEKCIFNLATGVEALPDAMLLTMSYYDLTGTIRRQQRILLHESALGIFRAMPAREGAEGRAELLRLTKSFT